MTRIVANPLAFPEVDGQTRRAVLTRFPYANYFRIDDGDVVVLAVHGRQIRHGGRLVLSRVLRARVVSQSQELVRLSR